MTRKLLLASLFALPLAVPLAGCGPSGSTGDDDVGGACTAGQTQCVGTQYQTCVGGNFQTAQNCTALCDPTSGCHACQPGVNACNGNDVVACNPDGTFGNTVQSCGDGAECTGGTCQRACTADGVDLIYVVDKGYRMLSFDPRLVGTGQPFQVIGQISCPAGQSVPDWTDPGPATPFSMAVDRDAVAWVLYTSGQIFNVSTQNAACTATSFPIRQNAGRTWDLFGMAFVTDAAGADSEKLWLGGGNVDATMLGDLGWIQPPTNFNITRVGRMSTVSEYSPELSGLGDATLWGFYPGLSNAFVQQIDKASGGGTGPQRAIPGGLGGTVAAWAFAQWGGKFYLFVTTTDFLGTENSTVRTIDRTTGQYQLVLSNLPYTIVGAGVSTCAPITIGHQLPWEALPQDQLPINGSTLR